MNISFLQILIICLRITFFKAEPLAGGLVRTATVSEFPSVVSIGKRHEGPNLASHQFCAGTVITKKHVITAAKCLQNKSAKDVQVLGGSANILLCEKYLISAWVTYNEFIFHDRRRLLEHADYNIAIITLLESVNPWKIRTALLVGQNIQKYYGRTGTTVGWGATTQELKPEMMHTANLQILSKKECRNAAENVTRRQEAILREKIICTWIPPVLDEADAGGPLLYGNEILVGINMHFPFDYQWLLNLKVNFHIGLERYMDFIRTVTEGEILITAP